MILPRISSLLFLLCSLPAGAAEWWNKDWTQRQTLTVDAGADAAALGQDVDGASVLVRLYAGNFQFSAASADGGDLRFVGSDGKLLPHQIEKFDNLVQEGFVWVKIPHLPAGGKASVDLYYGNASPAAGTHATDAYDGALVYHFSGASGPAVDATQNGNATTVPVTPAEGSLIGSGLRLLGDAAVTISASPSLEWTGTFTWSAWVKPAAARATAVIFSREGGGAGVRLSLDHGTPVLEVTTSNDQRRTSPLPALADAAWTHLAITSDATGQILYVNGEKAAQLEGAGPALKGPLSLGGLPPELQGPGRFAGEIDELEISSTARSAAWIKLAAVTQGTSPVAQKAVALGSGEISSGGKEGGHSKVMEHIALFGDIAHNMMFDGWMAIGLCCIMIATGWTVAVKKFIYLNSTHKGSQEFLKQWKRLSADLTALDHGDADSVRSLGGVIDAGKQALVRRSPLYEIYHIGSEEIRHRLARDKDRTQGLSGRSIQAIRAALDGGMVHATHKLTKGLVFLTISVAGGPYVGLLGTVVGVMITFAIIAKNGEVDVNSIAPGIASALLATVAGLVVAIPALFMYSYLNSRIKEATSSMQVFIDEFVAKMAEFYPPAGEASPYAPAPNDKAA